MSEPVQLTKSQERVLALSGLLHDWLSVTTLPTCRKLIKKNLLMLRMNRFGEDDRKRINQWEYILFSGDQSEEHRLNRIKGILYGRDQFSVDMRAVSPFEGVIPEDHVNKKLRKLHRIGEYAGKTRMVDFIDLTKNGGWAAASSGTAITSSITLTTAATAGNVTLINTPYNTNNISFGTTGMTITASHTTPTVTFPVTYTAGPIITSSS